MHAFQLLFSSFLVTVTVTASHKNSVTDRLGVLETWVSVSRPNFGSLGLGPGLKH